MKKMHSSDSHSALNVNPGAALKGIRHKKGWTLSQVSELTGFPVSTLSKIENGRTELTIDKLLRITLALGVNVADLFASAPATQDQREYSRRRSITRASEREFVSSKSGDYAYLAADLLSKLINPIIGEVRAKSIEEFGEFHRHAGEEFLYVLEGELILYTDTYGPTHLNTGDSIYFDSGMGHAYVAKGDAPCRIISVFSDPDAETIVPIQAGPPNLTILPKP